MERPSPEHCSTLTVKELKQLLSKQDENALVYLDVGESFVFPVVKINRDRITNGIPTVVLCSDVLCSEK